MNRLKFVPTLVVAGSLLAGITASASPLAPHVFHNAMFGKTHTINFKLRNDGAQPAKVMAGDQELTLMPGQNTLVKLNVGDKIVVAEATPVSPAGSVLATVSSALSDSTISFK